MTKESLSARRVAAAALAALSVLLFAATGAHAAADQWSAVIGLNASTPAAWVRVYTTGPGTTIYAGTEGDGIFRSVDSGAHWTGFSSGLPPHSNIRTIYTVGSAVYAGTTEGLFSNSGSGSWAAVAQGPEPDPANPTRLNEAVQSLITVGGTWLAGVASGGVYRSTDGGQTWKPPAPGNGMSSSETVWGLTSFANFVWAATSDGIYISADAGATWVLAGDGIPFGSETFRVFPDNTNPLIYYAATGDGLYRSLNGGVTWQPLDDPDYFGGTIEDIQQFANDKETRIYVAAHDGVWAFTGPNQTLSAGGVNVAPGEMRWSGVTQTGLGNNTIMWALRSFAAAPSTLLAGTESNGGYTLSFSPPHNTVAPSISGTVAVAQTLTANVGTWTGTKPITYDYQWQYCTASNGGCHDIPGATESTWFAPDDPIWTNRWIRVEVTAKNDAPEVVHTDHVAASAIVGKLADSGHPLPGEAQQSAASISQPGTQPVEGDTLSAAGWYFNPAVPTAALGGATLFQWLRCDLQGANCNPIPGATKQNYKLTNDDIGSRVEVVVTGKNTHGLMSLQPSGPSGEILPLPAENLKAPSIIGSPIVGSSLIGGVGVWKSPSTTYARQWERCEADGSDCSPIYGATGPEYTVTADDFGMTLRMHVSADVNPSYQLPAAVDVYTALTTVIQYPPGVMPPLKVSLLPPPLQILPPKIVAPKLSSLKLKGQGITFKLSAGGTVKIKLERKTAGHKVKSHCVAGHKKHAKSCTAWVLVYTITKKSLKAGSHTIKLSASVHGKPLKTGTYRAVVTPQTAGGKSGTSHTLSLTLRRG